MRRVSVLLVVVLGCVASCGGSTESTPATAPVPPRDPPATSPGDPPPSVAPTPGPPAAGGGCQTDADCVLSTSPPCCSCCQCAPLHAVLAATERARVAQCAVVECEQVDCDRTQCAPCGSTSASARAVCRDGVCAVVP